MLNLGEKSGLDASGKHTVLIETVGVGQDEVEITRAAHTTLVVMTPGQGDEVQASKAGLMECADVFAVNKADRDGADGAVRDLELMVALGKETFAASGKGRGHVVHGKVGPPVTAGADGSSWTPPILRCIATRGEGIQELAARLAEHRHWLEHTEAGRARKHTRLAEEVRESLREALIEAASSDLQAELDAAVLAVEKHAVDPYTATEQLVARFRQR